MTWLTGLVLAGAAVLLCIVWDLGVCGGKRCAQLVDRFVLFPQVRARRRARCDSLRPSPARRVDLGDAGRRHGS